MATQADLFGPKDETPWAKFPEMNKPFQGVVADEPYVGTERDFKTGLPKTYPDGNPKPQLTVKVRQNDGTFIRIAFNGAKLYALRGALQGAGVSEVKEGGTLGIAWTGSKPMDGGFDAKEYTVKYVPPGA